MRACTRTYARTHAHAQAGATFQHPPPVVHAYEEACLKQKLCHEELLQACAKFVLGMPVSHNGPM